MIIQTRWILPARQLIAMAGERFRVLQFGVKPPGLTADLSKVAMRFSCEAAFGKSSANGYERLLLDAMLGDATLFSHRDGG